MHSLENILPGQFFRHHRGGYYVIVCVSQSAEFIEDPVICYRKVGASSDGRTWHHRPEDFFKITPDGRQRFTHCDFQEVAVNLKNIDEGLYEAINAWGVRTFEQRQP